MRIYSTNAEYRVAHSVLVDLCKKFPDDPYLWEHLGKMYLDIGKRDKASAAFKKAEEVALNTGSYDANMIEAHKQFNEYLFVLQN